MLTDRTEFLFAFDSDKVFTRDELGTFVDQVTLKFDGKLASCISIFFTVTCTIMMERKFIRKITERFFTWHQNIWLGMYFAIGLGYDQGRKFVDS